MFRVLLAAVPVCVRVRGAIVSSFCREKTGVRVFSGEKKNPIENIVEHKKKKKGGKIKRGVKKEKKILTDYGDNSHVNASCFFGRRPGRKGNRTDQRV